MKKCVLFLLTIAFLTVTNNLFAQGTAFTYQGQLQSGGSPANGNYDFTFALYNNSSTNPPQLGAMLTDTNVGVTNGLFTVTLNFGSVFTGNATWLSIEVRTNGGTGFTALSPLQELTPTPYAIFAGGASAAGLSGTIAASNIANGTITSNLLAAGAVGSNQIASSIGLWSQSGSSAYYNQGSVGIGTSAPGVPLSVDAGLDSLNTFLNSSSTIGTWLTLGNTGGGAQWNFISTGSGNGEGASNLVIHPGVTLGTVNSGLGLQLQPDGKVGIDTRNLTSTLTVNGSGSFSGTLTVNGTLVAGYSGNSNAPGAQDSTIAGGGTTGYPNTIQGSSSFIGAGNANTISSNLNNSIIGAGYENLMDGVSSFIGSGNYNSILANADFSVLAGGYDNTIGSNSAESFIGSGQINVIQTNSFCGVIGGGSYNSILDNSGNSAVAGGNGNTIGSNSVESFIGSGYANFIGTNSSDSAVGGGSYNSILDNSGNSAVAGGTANTVGSNSVESFIGSGTYNSIGTNSSDSAIAGGFVNSILDNSSESAIANGYFNSIETNSGASFIGSGQINTIQADSAASFIGGGYGNVIQSNTTSSVIGGGSGNIAAGGYATVPGGANNQALGSFSFAAGYNAQALSPGDFVWADSQNAPFAATANDQFNVRAQGGVRFVTGGAGMTLDGQSILANTSVGVSLSGSFSGDGSGLTGLNASQFTSGTIPLAQLPSTVAFLNLNQTFTGQNNFSGNVGIGTTTPDAPLSLGSSLADTKLALFDNGSAFFGLGIQAGQFRLHTSSANDHFSFLTSSNGTETMTILGSGNVGIGTTTPGQNLSIISSSSTGNTSNATATLGLAAWNAHNWIIQSVANFSGAPVGAMQFVDTSTMVTNMTLAPNGLVGIGTSTPTTENLVVGGGVDLTSPSTSPISDAGLGLSFESYGGRIQSFQQLPLILNPVGNNVGIGLTNPAATLDVGGSGHFAGSVGIGTASPSAPLDVESYAGIHLGSGYFYGTTGQSTYNVPGGSSISIRALDYVAASGFIASSDARIKQIVGQSDSSKDLATLNKIKVTDYTYIDKVQMGGGVSKKVIAQQLEQVYPQAVSKSRNFIPDIFAAASVEKNGGELRFTLTKPHALRLGDKVRWIDDKAGAQQDDVTRIVSDLAFEVKSAIQPGKVFVYGTEVDDFRAVDYEAVSMLNVSATQELARQSERNASKVEALEKEVAELKKMVVQLAQANKNARVAAESTAVTHEATLVLDTLATVSLGH